MAEAFRCTVVTPEQELIDEQVSHVSLPLWDGQMGFLPGRGPLLGRLGYGVMALTLSDGSKRQYFVGGGFAQMQGNVLTVLTSEAREPQEIDVERAKSELEAAEAAPAVGDEALAKRERQQERARGLLRAAAS